MGPMLVMMGTKVRSTLDRRRIAFNCKTSHQPNGAIGQKPKQLV